MPLVKTRLALMSSNAVALKKFATFDPVLLNSAAEDFEDLEIDILILDAQDISKMNFFKNLALARMDNRIKKIVLLASNSTSTFSTFVYNSLHPERIYDLESFNPEDLFLLFNDIQQSAQNQVYLNLSSELNVEYEKIKFELEEKLSDKAKNLIESRQKIFDINSRIEFLRKTLYTISEIKSLDTAEEKLNELLTSYNKVTWFKIIPEVQWRAFEADISKELESTLFQSMIELGPGKWKLYFFKGDKKPFKKNDLQLFTKISETLQTNLTRIENLAALKQNENFYDLAFHSSKNPILVIDENYKVHQANNAALVGIPTKQEHCYELLFGRESVCVGCELGKNFQIQEKNSFFNVHSQPLNLMENEDGNFWVHVYEDVTEQNLYEKKLSQFARLEELGLISSSIAHELNNPLGGILSFIQIMKMELPQQHPLHSDLNMMHETGLRMKKIIDDLLIFSRTNADQLREVADLTSLTESVLQQFEMQFKVEKIKTALHHLSGTVRSRISKTHFKNSVSMILQFILQRAMHKRALKHNFISLVEVKFTQDQINYYLNFESNLGPLEDELKTKDLNLLAIEKTLTDQGFQLFISEPANDWIQLSVLIPKEFAN